MSPPAPREPLRLDLEDIRVWLLEHIDGGEEVRGYDSMLSTYINTIDAALAALPSEIAEPRGCPTPGACSAVEELADLKQRLLPQFLGRAERAEKARQMAVVERDEMLEKLRAATSMPCAPSATAAQAAAWKWGYEYLQERLKALGRDGWAHDCDGEIEARASLSAGHYVCTCAAGRVLHEKTCATRRPDAGGKPKC